MKEIMLTSLIFLLCMNFISYADTGIGVSDSGYLTSKPPDAPVLQSPVDEIIDLPDTVTVTWYSMIHAASYILQVSNTSNFTTLVVNNNTLTDTTFKIIGLATTTTYYWRVCATNVAGDGQFSEVRHFTTSASSVVDQESSSIPEHYALLPNCPNPFNPLTTITYLLPEKAEVSLVIYNCMGQSIRELVSGTRDAGKHKVQWDGQDNRGTTVTSGLYICHLKAGNHIFSQKMLLMR